LAAEVAGLLVGFPGSRCDQRVNENTAQLRSFVRRISFRSSGMRSSRELPLLTVVEYVAGPWVDYLSLDDLAADDDAFANAPPELRGAAPAIRRNDSK
jgi:hypothetical protein